MTWYEYESSDHGANDWVSTPLNAETIEDLKKIPLVRTCYNSRSYDLRIVKKTLTTEVIEVIK